MMSSQADMADIYIGYISPLPPSKQPPNTFRGEGLGEEARGSVIPYLSVLPGHVGDTHSIVSVNQCYIYACISTTGQTHGVSVRPSSISTTGQTDGVYVRPSSVSTTGHTGGVSVRPSSIRTTGETDGVSVRPSSVSTTGQTDGVSVRPSSASCPDLHTPYVTLR